MNHAACVMQQTNAALQGFERCAGSCVTTSGFKMVAVACDKFANTDLAMAEDRDELLP
jgi:hypothetical protein